MTVEVRVHVVLLEVRIQYLHQDVHVSRTILALRQNRIASEDMNFKTRITEEDIVLHTHHVCINSRK